MDPDQARQRDVLLDSNRWYIVYLKFVFEKGKIKKKMQEKKDAYKIMSMLRVHAYAC